MKFLQTELPGVIVIEPDAYRNDGWFLLESYHTHKYQEGGISATFVQDNRPRSPRGG